MANMSYCRFQNTLQDLRDCAGVFSDEDDTIESKEEQRAAVSLIQLCKDIADEFSGELEAHDSSEKLMETIVARYAPVKEFGECKACAEGHCDRYRSIRHPHGTRGEL